MDRALINGAPVAAPVTMQFALHRDAVYVSRACISLVCILRVAGQREEEREGEHGRGRGDDENGRVSAIGDPPVFAAQVTKP